MTFKLRVKVKYFFKSVLRLITQTPHSCIDGMHSYWAQWLLLKRSLKPSFLIADVTLKSTSRSHLHKTYIQLIQWVPLSFLERECLCLAEWLPMVCCLFYLILFIPVNIFLVKSCQDGSILGWTGTKQDLMFLACHVYFLQPWERSDLLAPLYVMFSCFFLSPSHTIPCPGSCVVLDCIDSWLLLSSLLCSRTLCSYTCETQIRNPSISTQALYRWVLHSHILWWSQWKF